MTLIIVSCYGPKCAVKKATNLLLKQKRGKGSIFNKQLSYFFPLNHIGILQKTVIILNMSSQALHPETVNNLKLTFTETFSTCFCSSLCACLTSIDDV